jgi:hypothetical protein
VVRALGIYFGAVGGPGFKFRLSSFVFQWLMQECDVRTNVTHRHDVTRRCMNLYSIFGNIKHEQIVEKNPRVQISMQTAVTKYYLSLGSVLARH